jgi:hypothetical protein
MRYLKLNMGFDKDMYLPYLSYTNVNKTQHTSKLVIEIHHTPFKLAEIVRTICNKHIIDHGFADEFDVGNEVMELHYRNLIGLVPLSHTVHELIHKDEFDIPPTLVYGYWKQYIVEYQEYFSEDSKARFQKISDWDHTIFGTVPEVLQVKYSLIECDGVPLYRPRQIGNFQPVQQQLNLALAA